MLAQILESATEIITHPIGVAISIALIYLFGKIFGYW